MVHPLIGIHATLGEFAVLSFLWALVEFLNPTRERMRRARIAGVIGLILILGSWLAGGYYYVTYYGMNIKPMIKAGPLPWAHGVVMESKEHLFLFLPFLAVLAVALLSRYANDVKGKQVRYGVIGLLVLLVLLGLVMAGMGYVISTGARTALEAMV